MAGFVFKLHEASRAFFSRATVKLRHCDVKKALLAPWSVKTPL